MLLEALIGLTLLGALITWLAPNDRAGVVAFLASLPPLVGSLWMYFAFDGSGNALLENGEVAFENEITWLTMGPIEVSWHVGVDGVSVPLIVLTTVLATTAIMSAWTPIKERQSQFYGLVLLLEAALIGVFAALDFLLWFVFWEAVLVPMYFLISVWGGPRRKYAAIKFFVYTNVASLVMFIAFAALVFALPVESFALPEITQSLRAGELGDLGAIPAETLELAAFVAIFAGLAVKVPVVPFHTWLPDAHVEAPTPVSVILAGVLLKMGTYALLRFNFTMMQDLAMDLAYPIAVFAVVSVLYGALLAMAQTDLKRIVAYSSVSSMGYVILGLVALTEFGLGGATFQMISHGLISGLLFMAVGVIYNQTHTRMVTDMSGLADRMPITVGVFVAAAFAYMGLPLMSGFAAEVYVFIGAIDAFDGALYFTVAAMFGIVLVAGYLLYAMQRTLFGPFRLETEYEISPASLHDVVPLLVLVGLIILLGTFPQETIFEMIHDGVVDLATGGVA